MVAFGAGGQDGLGDLARLPHGRRAHVVDDHHYRDARAGLSEASDGHRGVGSHELRGERVSRWDAAEGERGLGGLGLCTTRTSGPSQAG